MANIGLIAGLGRLPVAVAQAARRQGHHVVAVSVTGQENGALRRSAATYRPIPFGQWDQVIQILRAEGVAQVFMLGKVPKHLLFAGASFDKRFLALLHAIPEKNDDAILSALVNDLAKEGLSVGEQTALVPELVPQHGFLSKRSPTESEWEDIRFGHRMAKEIGRLDIGQTVVVKGRAVLAIEAIEGTDQAIRRGGRLGKGGAVVVKVAKPQQDPRFDVPTVGLSTLRSMKAVGATALAVDAGNSFLLDRKKLLESADKAGIAVVAVDPSQWALQGETVAKGKSLQ